MSVTVKPMSVTVKRPHRLSFGGVLDSELRKVVTLRSTWWTLGIAVFLQIGFAALYALAVRATPMSEMGPVAGVDVAVAGLAFSELAVVVFAVLVVSAEYSSGQIRVTIASVPKRFPVLLAKLLVASAVIALVGAVATGVSYGVAALIAGEDLTSDYSTAETLRMLAGGPLFLAGLGALSIGLAFVIRNTAGGIASMMGLILVLPMVLSLVPFKAVKTLEPWVPSTAGQYLLMSDENVELMREYALDGVAVFTPWQGYGVLLAWAAIALIAGAVTLQYRDV